MAVEEALYTLLTGNAGVSALVSTRIYPLTIPQNVHLPAIACQVITTEREYSHDGQSPTAGPYIQLTIQAKGTGTTSAYDQAKAIAAAVRAALSGFRGTVGSDEIGGIFLENEYDGYNLDSDSAVVRQDYRIKWSEV
jgi:hypothetical protein